MADVFISYSSNDHDKAVSLCQRLRAGGFSVWIDESNIGAAAKWTNEIVRGIEECSVFIVLLSRHSFGSHNVIKELSLASEAKKHIVPVDLESAELTHDVKYQLAGIQRVPYDEYERIQGAVSAFVARGESEVVAPAVVAKKPMGRGIAYASLAMLVVAIGAYFLFFKKPSAASVTRRTEIKKLVVIPFESLSSNKEDEYFADGLTAELITTLSRQSGLQVTDRQSSMQLKGRKGDVKSIAKELGVRYVVDGTIRKQDKSVRITAELIDAETGKNITIDNFEGSTDDLLGLQTKLARSIAFELQGTLEEAAAMDTSMYRLSTKNPEAYSVFLTAIGYMSNVTSNDQMEKGIAAMAQASKLDPNFVYPYFYSGGAYLARWQAFSHDPKDIDRCDSLEHLALKADPTFADPYLILLQSAEIRGQEDSAIAYAQRFESLKPDDVRGYAALGNIYYHQGKFDQAVSNLERVVSNNITALSDWSILIDSYGALGDTLRRNKCIADSKPLYDLFLQKFPTNKTVRLQYAINLANSGDKAGAHDQIARVLSSTQISGTHYYNIACTYALLNETKPALEMLRKSLDAGYGGGEDIAKDPDFARMKALPEFQTLAKSFAVAHGKGR